MDEGAQVQAIDSALDGAADMDADLGDAAKGKGDDFIDSESDF